MARQVSTDITVELDMNVNGSYTPYQPASQPTYSSGGDPPEDAMIEDAEVYTIHAMIWDRRAGQHVPIDLLDGLTQEVRKQVLNRFAAVFEAQIESALFDEAGESGE